MFERICGTNSSVPQPETAWLPRRHSFPRQSWHTFGSRAAMMSGEAVA